MVDALERLVKIGHEDLGDRKGKENKINDRKIKFRLSLYEGRFILKAKKIGIGLDAKGRWLEVK